MKTTDDFAKEFGDDFLELIAYVVIGDAVDDSIYISRETKHDAINSSGFGFFERNGKEYGFRWRNGNMDGFQIEAYSEELEDRYRPVHRVILPDEGRLKGAIRLAHWDWTEEQVEQHYKDVTLKIYEHKKAQFEKEHGELAYDLFFEPTDRSRKRMREFLEREYLKVEHVYGEVQ